ncbi:hypothetical protein ACFPPD_22265 [Cohnella suwonensis]|uniref:HTH luxR-type domain-containing protein n=1 Tax=Cohnella suwonensis TaxID=696072 RepID=A0ABW0LZV8_9BACL
MPSASPVRPSASTKTSRSNELHQRYAALAGTPDSGLAASSPDYANRALKLFEKRRTPAAPATPREVLVEQLARSELHLLSLIREGASNRLIAAAQRLRLFDDDDSVPATHT